MMLRKGFPFFHVWGIIGRRWGMRWSAVFYQNSGCHDSTKRIE